MPVYILKGSSSATLAGGTLTVSLTTSGTTTAPRLDVVTEGGGATRAVTPRPGLLVLPAVRDRVLVRVSPDVHDTAADVFPENALVTVSLSTGRDGDLDADRAVLDQIDVSGLPYKDLVSVTPADDRVVVAALEAAVEDPLPPLASAARTAARSLLGFERVPDHLAVDILVAVDASASVQPFLDDGSMAAALQVLTGVSEVASRGRSVRAALLGGSPTLLPPAAPTDLAATTVAALCERPLVCGLSGRLPTLSDDPSCVTYVVTTGPLSSTDGTASSRRLHHVVLAAESAWPLLRRGSAAGASSPVSFVPVAGRDGEVVDLLEASVLRRLVASLLGSCIPAGSPLAERLSS